VNDLRRYSLAAVVLLVILRLSIGWQLLYEGLWKIDTLGTARPWTSAGYLKNSVGPMRDTFRNMAGDPDELGWLDYDTVSGRWTDWSNRFQAHYGLDEKQAESLRRLLYGSQFKQGDKMVFAEALDKLPEGVEKLNVSNRVIWFDAGAKRLYVNAEMFLEPSEKSKLESLVKDREDGEAVAFRTALNRLYDRQKKGMGYLDKLKGALKGNAELLGNGEWQRVGKLEQYQNQLAEYERDRANAKTSFQWDHLDHTWEKLQTLRAELTSPIKAMEDELLDDAESLLTTDQMKRGPVSEPWTALRFTDTMTIAGLTILGTLLIVGLFSRFTALAAAFMLFNFYMAMPPWPGVPELPGPEHSFIINKNLIEVIALLGLATIPTGKWFGLDRLAGYCMTKCCSRRSATKDKAAASSGTQAAATA
jgi:uncharacterized membrane protein YphA (DoxX/SURF4 family)